MNTWQYFTSLIFLSSCTMLASAQTPSQQDANIETTPEQSQTQDGNDRVSQTIQYQSAESLKNYQTGPSFFVSARIGAFQSFDTQISSPVKTNFDDAFTGSAAGLRVGLLLDKWRTWIEINPAFAASKDDAEIEAKSILLATDYAVWQSDDRNQRFSVGAFASNLTINYTVDETGSEFRKAAKADGLSYGLQMGYRIDLTDYLFAGVDLQYALNGVQGVGDSATNNIDKIRVDDYVLANFELGFKF